MKKLISLVLALAMILMVGAVFATAPAPSATGNTITINSAADGETYVAYKMLDLSFSGNVDGNPENYTYTVNPDWAGFFNADNSVVTDVFNFETQGGVTYVTSLATNETKWDATSKLSKFAEAAAQYAKANNLPVEDTAEASGGSAVLDTNAGYYLITSTLGSRAMIDTTPGNVEIIEKNELDTIEKEVKEDSTGNYGKKNDAQIGDTIEFKTIAKITPRSVNVEIHDTMSEGLTFNDDIKIYTDAALETELATTKYTKQVAPNTGETFIISVDDTVAADISTTQDLYIIYTATLNGKAINSASGISIADTTNTTKITFGNNSSSEPDSTTTTTHKFSVFKHAKDETTNLAGAEFQLKKGTGTDATVLSLVQIDQEGLNYRIAESGETGAVTSFTTVASGDIVIWGVDSEDEYSLEEVNPPDGYNKLPDAKTINVAADDTTQIDVENNSGTELPSTGGMGTTIFYVIGGILLVGAAIILVARRKANN